MGAIEGRVLRALALGAEPAQVGAVDGAHHPGAAGEDGIAGGQDQALGGEERHLGVVGDGAQAAEGRNRLLKSLRSEAAADLAQRIELDRRAQRVAHRAGQERAADPVQGNLAHGSIASSTAAPKSLEL